MNTINDKGMRDLLLYDSTPSGRGAGALEAAKEAGQDLRRDLHHRGGRSLRGRTVQVASHSFTGCPGECFKR